MADVGAAGFCRGSKIYYPGMKLLPVFYDDLPTSRIDDYIIVDDSWVAEWKKMSSGHRNITITVESCKEALCKLMKISGLILTDTTSMESLRHRIVKATLNFLLSSSELDTENIQGCLRLCERISEMVLKNEKGVYCLGLYGIGGLGKTTMYKALYSYFGPLSVHRVCHLEIGSNDTDMNEKKFKRHTKILRARLDVSEDQIDKLEKSHADRKAEISIQRCLKNKQLKFLAVDNVQDGLASREEAGDYLKWLSPGGIIVITSRSRDNVLSVTRNPDFCKPIPNLKQDEAMTLFLKIAAPEVNWQSLDPRGREMETKKLSANLFFFTGDQSQS